MKNFSMLLMYSFVLGLFLVGPVWGELPPEAYDRWVKDFEKDIDTEMVISLLDVRFKFISQCTALYKVEEIKMKKEDLTIEKDDKIQLDYPCTLDKTFGLFGSTLPWAKKDDSGRIIMRVPSACFKSKGRDIWLLSGWPRAEVSVFAPVGYKD